MRARNMMGTEPDRILPVSTGLFRLWHHINTRRKWQVVLLTALALMMSLAEMATIGAVIPFAAVLVSPDKLLNSSFFAPILQTFSIETSDQLLIPICLLFAFLGLFASGLRLLQLYANIRFSVGVGTELSTDIYRKSLYQPYLNHTRNNSSELIAIISTHTNFLMAYVVLAAVLFGAGCITVLFVAAGLVYVDPFTTITLFGALGILYAIIFWYMRKRLHQAGVIIARESANTVKLLQEGLAGIRDVLIGHNQEAYAEAFRRSDARVRVAQGIHQFAGLAPRYAIEGLAMCAVALVAYLLSSSRDQAGSVLPVLTAVALGAQRLLPFMQQVFNSVTNIRSHQAILSEAVMLLDQQLPPDALTPPPPRLPFQSTIELRGVSFRYGEDLPNVLTDLSFVFRKGQRIGIMGTTGSGKSTLTDILMGLLPPTVGELLVDGKPINDSTRRAWQVHLSHVPQSIFLIDGSISENVALAAPGQPIDEDRVKLCVGMAKLSETVKKMPDGYASRVGERGSMLSGGQRQRIGIARALYKSSDVIVLDEATSALDNQTEQDVMQSIRELHASLTVFIVAHRLSTLRSCDVVIDLNGGRIVRTGSYDELIGLSNVDSVSGQP